jgi:hypothetical protein
VTQPGRLHEIFKMNPFPIFWESELNAADAYEQAQTRSFRFVTQSEDINLQNYFQKSFC